MLKVLEIALQEEGYLEKATNSQLDVKAGNPGNKNYTKYARDLADVGFYYASKQGLAWCDQFVDWCFFKAYGFENALKITGQAKRGYGAGCTESANYYSSIKRYFKSNPQAGDQIFFSNNGGVTKCHTGLVYNVENGKVYTIEGNTSSAPGVVANGGAVAKKSYPISDPKICGYGRPDYSLVENVNMQADISKVKYSSWKNGTIAEIPLNMIERISHEPMSGKGEYSSYAAKRIKWNNRYPDILSNAELFNMSSYAPASGVKEDGKIEYRGWQSGFGFKDNKIVWEGYGDPTSFDWIGGYPALIANGKKLNYSIPAGLEGSKQRTAMGISSTHLYFIWTKTGATLAELVSKFQSLGATYAINLDGGGSTSFVTSEEQYGQSRKLRGFVCVWVKGGIGNKMAKNPTSTSSGGMQQDISAKNGVPLMIVDASALNLRDAKGNVIATMPRNAKVMWYGYYTTSYIRSGKWYYVRYVDGNQTGYAHSAYLER